MQGAKLNEFVANLKENGLARNNRFAVRFGLPAILGGGSNPYNGASQVRLATLLCENIQLPGINLNTIQNRIYGEFRETPYETMYDNITATFYVDREMKVKNLWDKWILGIQGYNNPADGTGTRDFAYYKDYIAPQFEIYVNDTLNQTYYGVSLYEVYPKTISAITLDNNSKEIMKLTVTLQYKFWRPGQFSQSRSIVPVDRSACAPLPTEALGPQPVEQVGMWQDAWNDVTGWLGNPTIPEFDLNGRNFDLQRYNPF